LGLDKLHNGGIMMNRLEKVKKITIEASKKFEKSLRRLAEVIDSTSKANKMYSKALSEMEDLCGEEKHNEESSGRIQDTGSSNGECDQGQGTCVRISEEEENHKEETD